MSIVIVGGHDRMVGQYKKNLQIFIKCKCKVFTQMEADFGKKDRMSGSSGTFTNTVSHKMVKCALDEVGASTDIVRAAIPAAEMHSTVFSKHVADKYFSCIYCII